MLRDKMKQSLERLGIPIEDYRVIKLLPLIYVAWADGKLEPVKVERIHYFAAREYDLTTAGVAVLNRWLTECPSHDYVAEALRVMYQLARAGDDSEVEFSELPAIISYAEGIARSTAQALDEPAAVSARANSALEEIARELHVDHGESWGQLLSELS